LTGGVDGRAGVTKKSTQLQMLHNYRRMMVTSNWRVIMAMKPDECFKQAEYDMKTAKATCKARRH